MFCNQCSAENGDISKFCSSCGSSLQAEPADVASKNEATQENIAENEQPEKSTVIQKIGNFLGFLFFLGVLANIFGGNDETQKVEAKSQVGPVNTSAQAATNKNDKRSLLIGEWFCRNSSNYLHKVVYKPNGDYFAYDTPYVPGVAVDNTPLSYRGTFTLEGDVLRAEYESVRGGSRSESAVRIRELTSDSLVRYYPDIGTTEPCHKSLG